MKSCRLLSLLVGAVLPLIAFAQDAAPPRPRLTGVSHIGLWVHDLDKSRQFFTQYLGFGEPYSLKNKDGSLHLTFIKINDRQSVELFPISEKTPKNGDNLYHIALETDDAVGMLAYLKAHGVKGPGGKDLPDKVGKGKIGNLNYFIEDPDQHIVEIVQYAPEGKTAQTAGQFMPDTRIAPRISHVGVTVRHLDKSLAFYEGILGMKEFWRGSKSKTVLSWVNVRLPESNDYIELMLYSGTPTLDRLHTMNHMCLEVPEVSKVDAILKSRTLPPGCKPPTPIATGVNRKRQINAYDPDGTRVEIMDAATIDGKPTPSSKAPPPA